MATKDEHSLTVEALERIGKDHDYAVSSAEQQAMIAVLEEQGQKALKAVLNIVPLPRFQYHLSSPTSPNFGFITLGKEKIHQIDNTHEFYRALGHTDELRLKGILAEEFICNEYLSGESEKSEVCLQTRIIKYLSRDSETFLEKFAAQCKYWLESCRVKCMSNSPVCMNCSCNPYL